MFITAILESDTIGSSNELTCESMRRKNENMEMQKLVDSKLWQSC